MGGGPLCYWASRMWQSVYLFWNDTHHLSRQEDGSLRISFCLCWHYFPRSFSYVWLILPWDFGDYEVDTCPLLLLLLPLLPLLLLLLLLLLLCEHRRYIVPADDDGRGV